jgi:hypothetical protein
MTIINSNEFFINQEKYFDMALNEDVYIRKGENMFAVTIADEQKNEYLEPDDDLRRAITADEFLEGALKIIDKIYAKK